MPPFFVPGVLLSPVDLLWSPREVMATKEKKSVTDARRDLVARGLFDDVSRMCKESHVTFEELCAKSRRNPCATECRKKVWTWLHGKGFSFPTIAAWFGRDHTTILVAVRGRKRGKST